MIAINDALLGELALSDLPQSDRNLLRELIYEQLELRVGNTLASRMSTTQMDEFENFIDSDDEQGAFKWLESNFPDYASVTSDELAGLRVEILDHRVEIRSILVRSAPTRVTRFLQTIDVDGDVGSLARDLFVHIGDVGAICDATIELLNSVPGLGKGNVEKIAEACTQYAGELASLGDSLGLSKLQLRRLLERFGGWGRILAATDSEIVNSSGLGRATAEKIRAADGRIERLWGPSVAESTDEAL